MSKMQKEVLKRSFEDAGTTYAWKNAAGESQSAGKVQKMATGGLALGVPGDPYDNSPMRVQPFIVDATRKVGGYVPNFGLIVNRHEYALYGGLEPSLALVKGQQVNCASMGHFVVSVGKSKGGAKVYYATAASEGVALGDLSCGTFNAETGAQTAPTGDYAEVPNARIVIPSATDDGLSVIELG